MRAINGGAFPRAHPSGTCGLLACPSLSHDRITRATRRSESEPGARADEASKQRCDWGTASMEKRAAAAATSPARKETGISDSTRRDDRLRLLRDSLQVRPRSAHGDHLPVAEDAGEENASRRTGGKERGSPSARSFIDRSTTARTRPLPLFFQHSALSLLHVFFACSLKTGDSEPWPTLWQSRIEREHETWRNAESDWTERAAAARPPPPPPFRSDVSLSLSTVGSRRSAETTVGRGGLNQSQLLMEQRRARAKAMRRKDRTWCPRK